jgi:hypothetical protein
LEALGRKYGYLLTSMDVTIEDAHLRRSGMPKQMHGRQGVILYGRLDIE